MIITFLILLLALAIYLYNLPVFGGKAEGKRLVRMKQSPNYKDGAFQNLSFTPPLAEGYTMGKVIWEFLTDKTANKKPGFLLPTKKLNLKEQLISDNFLVWMGHSSYYFQLDGKRFLVDPVFSGNASPIPGTTKAFTGTDIYSAEDFPEIDFLIISHDHYDHLDYKTIKSLHPKIDKVICGLGVGSHFEKWGFDEDQIVELDWYEDAEITRGFKITSTPARHFSGRMFKRNNTLWSSYVLETPTKKIFVGGDSGYDFHFKEIGEKFGPFDWAILENGQYNEKWRYIHTLPEEFVKVAEELNVKNILPVHSGKFALAQHSWNEPLQKVYENSQNKSFKLFTPLIGEKLELDSDSQIFSEWWKS
ncbi:MBL fold metallo-hydrolase [Epilithonimonas hungarica]|uniref:L-ascorbate metabolism protein UlaG, beta-lactamase superfamily n=1 Tax=Epilithonimonas hungarica TaxID=454006 RepID=A0A1G7RSC5_9FLAO|nr:MBL fold metallo-hydrolase [Epilithonimonas hungarica]SDG13727.1 L-ascorbate metabolism protein UlaG, beta-lactamase superfamily [Epilithonimonas hungarica]